MGFGGVGGAEGVFDTVDVLWIVNELGVGPTDGIVGIGWNDGGACDLSRCNQYSRKGAWVEGDEQSAEKLGTGKGWGRRHAVER